MRTESPTPDQMLYGYHFKDRRKQPLESLAVEARSLGYEVVSLSAPFDHWKLHVRRIQSRHVALAEGHDLVALGQLLDVETFEGVDVKPLRS